tara:strand:+ start:665 stop:2596 length:1932 start_codon:yes stop_codon:yes gene_type:complete
MSSLKVSSLAGRVSGDAPTLTDGAVLPVGVALTGGGGINVTGIITGSSYRGDGSQLTGIDASALKSGGSVKVQATATGAEVTGNLSVGGTLTYQDVQNVDSVGLVTARSGLVVVSGGASITAGGLNVTGVVTATSFSGSGANLSGIDASPTIEATASGTIGDNVSVFLNADGKVSSVILTDYSESTGSAVNAASTTTDTLDNEQFDSVQIDNNTFAVCWANGYIYVAIGTVSGTTITFGTPVTCGNGEASQNENPRMDYEKDVSGCLVIAFDDAYNTRQGVVALSFSGSTLTAGSYTHTGASTYGKSPAIACGNGGCVAYWMHQPTQGQIRGVTVTTGRVVTIGGVTAPQNNSGLNANSNYADMTYLPPTTTSEYGNDRFLMSYMSGSTVYIDMLTRSGTSVTNNHSTNVNVGSINSITYESIFGGAVVVYKSGSNYLKARKVYFNSGASNVNVSGETTIDTDNPGRIQAIYQKNLKKVYVIVRNGTSARTDIQTLTPTTASGLLTNGPQYDNIVTYETARLSICPLGRGRIVHTIANDAGTQALAAVKQFEFTATSYDITSDSSFVGFSAASYTDGQTVKVKVVGNTAIPPSIARPSPGFTTATRYYITGLGTVSDSNTGTAHSITAGIALNSTTLLINPGR